MKIKIVCHSNQDNEGFARFKKGMELFSYDYIALNDPQYNWAKTFDVYLKYVKTLKDLGYTHVLTTDCWDVVVFSGVEEVISKYKEVCPNNEGLFSVERACYPDDSLAQHHETTEFDWRYINCGGTLFPVELFIDVFSNYNGEMNIQEWAIREYLFNNKGRMKLDLKCEIFQTTGHKSDKDFTLAGKRLLNNITKSLPVFAHENGRGDMTWINKYWDKEVSTL